MGHATAGLWRSGLADAAGTVSGYVDATGLIGSLRETDPFGAPRDGSAPPDGIGYTGEWSDPMGLLNLRHRAYDPELQRFVGRDTFGGVASAGQTWNRYAYVTNNPLGYTDPTGHFGNAINQIGNFIDRYGADIAGFGVSIFTGWVDFAGGVIGRDLFTGRELVGWERGLYMASAVPGVKALRGLGNIARMAKAQAATRASRMLDSLRRTANSLSPSPIARFQPVAHLGNAAGSAMSRQTRPGGWTRSSFAGNRVYQRDDLIDPARIDAAGRTNLERMRRGWAPVGSDGEPINLHHMLQTQSGPIIEITATMHRRYARILHINPNSVPSGIDRGRFDAWRAAYWEWRSQAFARK